MHGILLSPLGWCQCRIQSYFEGNNQFGISKSDPQTLKSVKINSSKNRQMITRAMFWAIQNAEWLNFWGFCLWTPLGRDYSAPPPPHPRLPSCITLFLFTIFVVESIPPKNCWIRHWVPLVSTWKCYTSYKNGYSELSVLHLLPLLNSGLSSKCSHLKSFL